MVEIRINNFKTQQKFVVAEQLAEDLILGIDFLQESKCQIDIIKQELKFSNQKHIKPKLIAITLSEELSIQPKEQKLIIINKFAGKINLENLVIQPSYKMVKTGIWIPDTIIPIGRAQKCRFR